MSDMDNTNSGSEGRWWNGEAAQKTKRVVKRILVIAGGVVVFLVLLELGLHAAYALFPQQATEDMRFSLSPYKDKPWATELANDEVAFGNMPLMFDRYDEWERSNFSSTYINVDVNGIRKSWNPQVATGTSPKQIWFMGGSSIFGAGARDDYTIPSDFSKLVNANSASYQIVNHGMYAYVFPQSVVAIW